METLKKILAFFNLLDNNGNVSITNVSAIILITKLALTSNPDLATVGSTAIALLNYAHKRSAIKDSIDADKQ